MAGSDREEARNLGRFLRFAQLRGEVEAARRVDESRQRLELQLRIDATRYRAMSTASHWRVA
jgi:hypothetical protein